MLEVRVEHLGDWQFEIRARGHKLISDQPIEAGGYDEGVTPPELLLASLGSCAGYYAADYLKREQLATAGTRVRVTAEKVGGPSRLDQFRISVEAPAALTERQEEGLHRAVERCLVHNTLLHPPKIKIVVQHEPALAVASRSAQNTAMLRDKTQLG
jgi:putative redox protein